MSGKEATIYIVDQGASTGECHNGRVESDLDYGMRYIWDKIAGTMISNRTTAGVGVIGFRTDETENELAESDPEAYSNISVMKPLGPMEMPHLKDLQHRIKPSDTDNGDAVSAIVVGIQLIEKFTTLKTGKPGKYARKIVLLTDGQGPLEDDDIDPIAARINELDIELVVVYVLPIERLKLQLRTKLAQVALTLMTRNLDLSRTTNQSSRFVQMLSPNIVSGSYYYRQEMRNFSKT
jgi:ATP-dependent DNA helicase 2 subunit 2